MPSVEFLAQRLALALAIGFLIGIERGWKQRALEPGDRAAGLRTYTLAGFLGGVSAALSQVFGGMAFAALALAFAASLAAFKLREAREQDDFSATGMVAGLLTFALGALALVGPAEIVAGSAVAVALILAFKETLHGWLARVSWPEMRSALLVLAMTMIVLPVTPNRTIDPWALFNPRELWLLTVLIAGASFAAYVALRAFGERRGLMIGAVAGALISSTLVTTELARQVKAGAARPVDASSAAAAANLVMLARVAALSSVFAPSALAHIWPVLLAAGLAAALAAAVLYFKDGWRDGGEPTGKVRSPLDLKQVFRFAAVLCALLILVRIATRFVGNQAILPLAALSGLLDVDAVVLALGQSIKASVPAALAGDAILLAVLSDTALKVLLARTIGGAGFAAPYALAALAAAAAGGLTRWLAV